MPSNLRILYISFSLEEVAITHYALATTQRSKKCQTSAKNLSESPLYEEQNIPEKDVFGHLDVSHKITKNFARVSFVNWLYGPKVK